MGFLLGPISQKSLHDRKIDLLKSTAHAASLFPFFDDYGIVHSFMFVRDGSGFITEVPRRLEEFDLKRLGPFHLRRKLTELADLSDDGVDRLAALWHFDPWWVLGRQEFTVHPAVPALKGTNLPGYQEDLVEVWFDRTLSRVQWLGFQGDEGVVHKKFTTELIRDSIEGRGPVGKSVAAPVVARGGWQLKPFWAR